ncbi:MAG: choice-of-anchor D domain-containing protein, partial [Terriglobales bacterium]
RHQTLSANASSVGFGSTQVGSTQTQYETLTNSGNSTVTISQAGVSGAGFSVSGLSLPLDLSQGQSVTFSVLFSPKATGAVSGSITVTSNASNSSLAIALSGAGLATAQLSSSTSRLDFGSVSVGASKTLTATLTATGSSVTISAATSTSPEFHLGGITLPLTLAAGQTISVSLTFTPQSSGAASGSISLGSNAANAPVVETLTGSGAAAGSHSVSLHWTASSSTVAGYNVYRGSTSGGPYVRVNPVLNAGTGYVDGGVQSGATYYYVSTAVNSGGTESKYSGETQVVIPNP